MTPESMARALSAIFTQVLHLNVLGPGPLREGLHRAVVKADILMSNIPNGNTAIHGRGFQKLHSSLESVRKSHSELGMENSHWISFGHLGPRHHAEVAIPGAQAVQNHPLLQSHCSDHSLLGSNWTKAFNYTN